VARTIALAGLTYAAYGALTWLRFGSPKRASIQENDPLLDRFMPSYDVAERHHARVDAPAEITLAAAREQDLLASPIVRGIFRAREVILGAAASERRRDGLLAETLSLGWGILAEVPGHEIVVGAVTRPWESHVTFHALPPDEFAAFREPGHVKIAWTLRADALGGGQSVFRTETRAVATDGTARAKFRRYWAAFSPGIVLIRWLSLPAVKREAERRARAVEAINTTPGEKAEVAWPGRPESGRPRRAHRASAP
jgi:hypothetical protein